VPTLPATSHAWHWPAQAALQQTPSVQKPLAHWLAAPHASPGIFFATHVPAEHQAVAAQSESEEHVVLQSVAPQAKWPQLRVTAAAQFPVPAHFVSSVAVPAAHEGARHCVETPGYAHAAAFVPSQAPAHDEPSESQAVRWPRGAPVTDLHVPALPVSAHASHWPLQALSQQTPSVQKPLAH